MKSSLFPAALAACMVLAGCHGKEYKYVRGKQPLPQGKTQGLTDAEKGADSLVAKVTSNAAAVQHFRKMFKSALLEVVDFDSLTFTVKINADTVNPDAPAFPTRCEYVLGTAADAKPDLVIPVHKQNLANLLAIFEDGTVTEDEQYRIHRATFGNSLRSLFQVEALYNPHIAKRLALPNFIHMTLKNVNNVEFMGTRKEATVTILNVDGQWLVTPGAWGDPDVTWAVTPKELADFQKLVFEPGKGAARSNEAAKARLQEIKDFLDRITVYRRK